MIRTLVYVALTEDYVPTETLVLDKLPVRFSRVEDRLGSTFLGELQLTRRRDEMLDGMVYEMSSYVLAEKLVDKIVTKPAFFRVHVHASWWQHFKDEVLDRFWATRWFVRWHPVRFDALDHQETLVANFQQYATFPSADIRTPERYHGGVIIPFERVSYS